MNDEMKYDFYALLHMICVPQCGATMSRIENDSELRRARLRKTDLVTYYIMLQRKMGTNI